MITGITGHQNISNVVWVQNTLAAQIRQQGVTYGLSCLAAGADQLFANILYQRHIPYTAVIPCDHYEDSFEEAGHLETYQTLLSHAQNVHRMSYGHPSEPAYWAAGQYIVGHCALLIAVWNGKPALGLGGTGDVVEYARQHKRRIVHLNPDIMKIVMIEGIGG